MVEEIFKARSEEELVAVDLLVEIEDRLSCDEGLHRPPSLSPQDEAEAVGVTH